MVKIQTVFTQNEDVTDIDLSIFSDYRRKKIALCRNPESRICSISASLALLRALAKLGISERDTEYSENEFGKPYFTNIPNLHFSISHTNGLAVAVLSDTPIGVDCESSDRTVSSAVLKRFFSSAEISAYEQSPISLWTAKEAFSKLLGKPFAECSKILEIPYFEEKLILNGIEFQRIPLSGFDICIAKQI